VIKQQARLLDELAAAGRLSEAWRPHLERVPRHEFVPEVAWFGWDNRVISRADEPEAWLDAAYADGPIVTQFDDGKVLPGGVPGLSPSSSLSMPRMVARMLDAAMIVDGVRVLEIGTGSGWSAALLADRLGDANVTSVEIDTTILRAAQRALQQAGYAPTTVAADGTGGYAAHAPYDRVLATCSVYRVPPEWIAQTRPGGYIVTPWRLAMPSGLLVRLQVDEDGTASGPFVCPAWFMVTRNQRRSTEQVPMTGPALHGRTSLRRSEVFESESAQFAVAVLVPNCDQWTESGDAGVTVRLDDLASGSWAAVAYGDESGDDFAVRQGGPRRLWDEVEAAYAWWQDAGRPEYTRFGLTVDGAAQRLWIDEPGTVVANL